jgi:hypothetical protein
LPQKRNYQGGVVRALVAEAKKEKEKKRVQKVVTEASLDVDLAKAIEVRQIRGDMSYIDIPM